MEFYKNKRVIITGGAGFVGNFLAKLLQDFGASVTVLDPLYRADPHKYPKKLSDYEHFYIDCGNDLVGNYLNGVDVVFNLAANVAGVIHNADNNGLMFKDNVNVQTIPVTAAARTGVPHFLQVSSVCVYSPRLNHPALEENGHVGDPHIANHGYAWSKRMGERVATWQQDSFEKMVIVRPANVYGPRDWFDDKAHVVPALIKKVDEATDKVILHGTGNEVRELSYVIDTAHAMAHAMAHGVHGETYNIGSGQTYTIFEIVTAIMEVMGKKLDVWMTPDAESGDPFRWSNFDKLLGLGWNPMFTDIHDNLETVCQYYGEFVRSKNE